MSGVTKPSYQVGPQRSHRDRGWSVSWRRDAGVALPRRAISQSKAGDPAGRLQRGDLLFFSSDVRRSLVTHVGIYEGAGLMIDASKRHGRVRRDMVRRGFSTAEIRTRREGPPADV